MRYSVIIPVYNRPDEVDELLQSLTVQHFKGFEVVVVEDGSSIPCKGVVDRYADRLNIKYFSKPNSGPGQTRNYGAERSESEYLIILDSDAENLARYSARQRFFPPRQSKIEYFYRHISFVINSNKAIRFYKVHTKSPIP